MGRLPLGKQPTFGDTLQELTWPLVDQSPSGSCLSVGIGAFSSIRCGSGRRWWNLETSLGVVEFLFLYLQFPPLYKLHSSFHDFLDSFQKLKSSVLFCFFFICRSEVILKVFSCAGLEFDFVFLSAGLELYLTLFFCVQVWSYTCTSGASLIRMSFCIPGVTDGTEARWFWTLNSFHFCVSKN